MNKEKLFKSISGIVTLFSFLFIVSFSILVPSTSRKFYYYEVDRYKIDQSTGIEKNEIINAYDDVMDFIWRGKEFKTGTLNHSEKGAEHFKDVRTLFRLNLAIFIISTVALITYILLYYLDIIKPYYRFGYSPLFYGAIIALFLSLFISVFALIDFFTLFYFFHLLFFPFNEDWVFDSIDDEIINILTIDYFKDCAIMFAIILLVLSFSFIIYSKIKKAKSIKKSEN